MFTIMGSVFGPVGLLVGAGIDYFLSGSISLDSFLKISTKKKKYHEKNFISMSKYDLKKYQENMKEIKKYTQELLSKPCEGKIDSRDTLLHVLAAFSKSQGKECLFTNDKSNQNSIFINTIGKNDNQNFVLTLENLDDVSKNETKSNKKQLQNQLLDIKKDLIENKKNNVIESLKIKLGKVHGVDPKYIRINDIYYGTANVDYDIITSFQHKGDVCESLKQQFKEYKDLKLHPLFFDESFNINDFDKRGNKEFNNGTTYKVGPKKHEQTYIQPTGWTRYGLKVLDGRYGNDNKWLDPFQDPGNWYRAFHGTSASCGKLIMDGDIDNSKAVFKSGNGQIRKDDMNKNPLSPQGRVGRGVYCSPNPKTAESYCKNNVTIQTTKGSKTFKFMFQVCVDPKKVRFTHVKDYWLVPDDVDAIRPYGILLKEV